MNQQHLGRSFLRTFAACAGLLIAAVTLSQGCQKADNSGTSTTGPSGSDVTIAVIPKGMTHEFWKSVKAGADQAGQDLHATIKWQGPQQENDRAQEVSIVEQFVGDKVSAIVVAPLDDTALLRPVQEAGSAGIPVVVIDSALKGEPGKDFISFVASDNTKGGELAGEEMVKLLGGKGKVVLLRYMEGSASTADREAGFLEVMKKTPGITMISDSIYGGATASESQTAALNLIDTIKQADGVFCPNESSTVGMMNALDKAQLIGKLKFVGFDATSQLIDALRAGKVDALVAQNPYKMGYEGVKAAMAAIQKKPVEVRIDTGVKALTKADLDDPEVKLMLGGNGSK